MSDDESNTNADYYGHLWTKPMKVRSAPKRLKPKRVSKKLILLGDVSVGAMKHFRRLLNKRIHTGLSPLLRREFPRQRR